MQESPQNHTQFATNTLQNNNPLGIKALIFDVFGTLVDWRSSVAAHAQQTLSHLHLDNFDYESFADDWRDQYQPSMQKIRSAQVVFSPLDTLHLNNLNVVLNNLNLREVPEATKHLLNHAWHILDAWSDTKAGLERLRRNFLIAPCSNGNISLMIDLARHNDLRWDAVLGAEIAGNYKPHPSVYTASVKALGLEPNEVMMVAAHSSDLSAASALGLRTAFVARPLEHGPTGSKNFKQAETKALCPVDLSAHDLLDLAKQLGC